MAKSEKVDSAEKVDNAEKVEVEVEVDLSIMMTVKNKSGDRSIEIPVAHKDAYIGKGWYE